VFSHSNAELNLLLELVIGIVLLLFQLFLGLELLVPEVLHVVLLVGALLVQHTHSLSVLVQVDQVAVNLVLPGESLDGLLLSNLVLQVLSLSQNLFLVSLLALLLVVLAFLGPKVSLEWQLLKLSVLGFPHVIVFNLLIELLLNLVGLGFVYFLLDLEISVVSVNPRKMLLNDLFVLLLGVVHRVFVAVEGFLQGLCLVRVAVLHHFDVLLGFDVAGIEERLDIACRYSSVFSQSARWSRRNTTVL